MKYLFIVVMAIASVQCSPRLSPDWGWDRQRWVLVEMKGVPVQQSGGRRDAFISFNVTDKKFNGNGGCNQINGNYTLDRNDIRFTEVIATKMSCPDIEFENAFLRALNDVDRYEINGDEIRLKNRRETLLVLRSRQVDR